VKPVRVARDEAEEEVLRCADEAGALLEPVQWVERSRLELRATGGLPPRRCDGYFGTSSG
jgi:hypothetical protein